MFEKLAIFLIVRQEDDSNSSDLCNVFRVCKDKEHFEIILEDFVRMAKETAKDFYKILEKRKSLND